MIQGMIRVDPKKNTLPKIKMSGKGPNHPCQCHCQCQCQSNGNSLQSK